MEVVVSLISLHGYLFVNRLNLKFGNLLSRKFKLFCSMNTSGLFKITGIFNIFLFKVSIRGRIVSGQIIKKKMHRTVVIRRDYLHYVKKYNRFQKRHKNMSVHMSPCFRDVSVLFFSIELLAGLLY